MTTVCFTGHRPHIVNQHKDWIQGELSVIVKRLVGKGVDRFISGGALGVDQWAAWTVIETYRPTTVKLTIAQPFPSFRQNWDRDDIERYRELCLYSDEVLNINPDPFNNWKYHARNQWMVNNSSAIVAVWNGKDSGGAYATVELAKQSKKPIYWINPELRVSGWIK